MSAIETQLVQMLMRHDAKQFFANNCEEIYGQWMNLLRNTTFPIGCSCLDKPVMDAIMAVHSAVTQSDNHLAKLLAYIRLSHMLICLKNIIKQDRRKGVFLREQRRKNATIAIELYMQATGINSKEQVHKLVRNVNRCAAFGKTVPLLLLVLSDDAVRIL